MGTKEVELKARRLKMLKNRQEELQTEIDQLEADLKADLDNRNCRLKHFAELLKEFKPAHPRKVQIKNK